MPEFDSLSLDQLLHHIRARLERERSQRPAFTLLLGSGFSAPLIPTARQIVERDAAWWLHWRDNPGERKSFKDRPAKEDAEDAEVRGFERKLWPKILQETSSEAGSPFRLRGDFPDLDDADNVSAAYRALMSGRASSGLSDPEWRRRYLRDLCARVAARVNGAHLYLASILRAQDDWTLKRPFCRTIFTTNFDPLLQRSLQLCNLLYFMSDRPEALEPPEDDDHDAIHLVYSHGSVYRYLLLNTGEEIERARSRNATALIPYFQRHGVLVVGYSGWLDATMDALMQCQSFYGNLYWCDVHDPTEAPGRLSEAARNLLKARRDNAFYVAIPGADELMLALHEKLELGATPNFIRDPIGQMIEDLQSVQVPMARESTAEPRAIDSLRDSRDRTVDRLRAAQIVFAEPSRFEAGGQENRSGNDQRILDAARIAQIMDEALRLANATEYGEAIKLWTKVVEDESAPVEVRLNALLNRGIVRRIKGDTEGAVADSTDVIEAPGAQQEQRAMALANRGVALGKQENRDRAMADYTAVVEMSHPPADALAIARINRGVIYGQHDNLLAEIADYTAALELPSLSAEQRARALVKRGIAYRSIDQGKTTDIRRDLADYTAVIAMPDAPFKYKAKALVNRGAAYGDLGLDDLELADYNAVLQAEKVPIKERTQALVRRGGAYGRQGHFELEIADYDALLSLPAVRSKERVKALLKRAAAYLKSGKIELAIADYTEVAKATDLRSYQKALILEGLAWAHFLASPTDPRRLIEDSQAALSLAPDLTAARFHLGLGLLLAGEVERAVGEYSQAEERETTSSNLREARQDLKRFADSSDPTTAGILMLLRSREMDLEKSRLSNGASHGRLRNEAPRLRPPQPEA